MQFHGSESGPFPIKYKGHKDCAFLMDEFVPMLKCSCDWNCSCAKKCLSFNRPSGYIYVFRDDGG